MARTEVSTKLTVPVLAKRRTTVIVQYLLSRIVHSAFAFSKVLPDF